MEPFGWNPVNGRRPTVCVGDWVDPVPLGVSGGWFGGPGCTTRPTRGCQWMTETSGGPAGAAERPTGNWFGLWAIGKGAHPGPHSIIHYEGLEVNMHVLRK